MKADAYTGFLTNKVKIFGTTKEAKPIMCSGRKIRQFAPFLLASALMVSSCTQKKNNENQTKEERKQTLTEQYQKIVTDVRDNENANLEPLPVEFIEDILKNPNAPVWTDKNYNHMPEDQANFWEIVRNGIVVTKALQENTSLSESKKAEYMDTAKKMLGQILRVQGTKDEVDLSHFNNLKAFLYFEKVCHYKEKHNRVLEKREGWLDERTEIFGRYYKDQESLRDKMEQNEAVMTFAEALYSSQERFILTYQDSIEANKISYQILNEWMEKQNIKDENLWAFSDVEDNYMCNMLVSWRARGDRVGSTLYVDSRGDCGDMYCPVGLIIEHELSHAMQKKPASDERPEDNQIEEYETEIRDDGDYAMELGPTLKTLMHEDRIYKEINGIEQDTVMDYGVVDLGTHKVKLGELAVWFRKMDEKYPHQSVDKLIEEKEVFEHLVQLGKPTPVKVLDNTRGGIE